MVQISSICIHYVPHIMCEPCFQWFDLKNDIKRKFFFSLNIIIKVSIWIVICELNKVHEIKEFVVGECIILRWQEEKKSCSKCTVLYTPCTISVITIYNGINFIYMHKLYLHECVNYVPNSLTFKIIKTNKTLFYFIFNAKCN